MPFSVDTIFQRYETAKGDRQNFDWHWQEVADLVLPTRDFTIEDSPAGNQRRNFIFNETAPAANESLSAALHGFMSNTALRWFGIVLTNNELNRDREVQAWLYAATNIMLSFFNSPVSGWATHSHEVYLDLGAFGTGVMLMRESRNRFKFQARQLSNMYVIEDDEGVITDFYRIFEMTNRDIVTTFGDANPGPSQKIIDAANDTKSAGQKCKILHAVIKNDERDPTSPGVGGMEWASFYLEVAEKSPLSQGGFRETPYLLPRWSKAPEEVYGRGPAMTVLPAIKTVNAMDRDILVASEQAVRPPVNVFANSLEGPISTKPGSINYIRSGTREMPEPMKLGVRPDLGDKVVERHEARIEEAFFLDTLRLPDRDRMTAEEIITRRQQGLIKASPVMSRVIAEFLSIAIKRVFNWHLRTGRFPPMPSQLENRKLDITYNSPMAASQKQAEAQAIQQSIVQMTPLIQADPTIMLNVDGDEAFRATWVNMGADPKLLRDPREVTRLRVAMTEQAALAEQAAATRDFAAAGKSAAEATGIAGRIGA